MLTLEDCIELSKLTEDEIDAIVEHEHVPEMIAAEIGAYLVATPTGEKRIASYIRDDIEYARRSGDIAHAARLRLILRHYLEVHPQGRGE